MTFQTQSNQNIATVIIKNLHGHVRKKMARNRVRFHINDVIHVDVTAQYSKALSFKMATSAEHAAQRAVIKYCVERGMTPIQTKREMEQTKCFGNVSRTLVYTWHKRFSTNPDVNIMENRGRKKKDQTTQAKKVKDVLDVDRRQTVREVAEKVHMSKSVVQRLLTGDLKMSRVCARWVPRLLSEDEMRRRVSASNEFLRRHSRDRNFLSNIITMDETWVHYFEPEGKRQSSVWKSAGTPPPKKARLSKSMGKVMFMVFMDQQGVILAHAVRRGETINAEYYSKVVRRDLMHAIRKKRPAVAENLENVLYHHDNAPAHSAANTHLDLALLGFQRLVHPPYSPDLAPLDFAYFPALKSHLRGTRFSTVDDIRIEVKRFNRSLGQSWFQDVFDKWVCRHNKCVEHAGRYFEKE